MSRLHPEHLRMGFEAVIRPRAVMVGLPQTGQTARHRKPRRDPDDESTSRICQPETVVPAYFFWAAARAAWESPFLAAFFAPLGVRLEQERQQVLVPCSRLLR